MDCHWEEPNEEKEQSLLCIKSGPLGDNWVTKHCCPIRREETALDLTIKMRSCPLGVPFPPKTVWRKDRLLCFEGLGDPTEAMKIFCLIKNLK